MSKKTTTLQGLALSRFCRQLFILQDAGVSLSGGMEAMAEDAETEEEKKRLLSMAEALSSGDSLSSAMEQAGCFPDYAISTVRLGESTGNQASCMEGLADHYEQEYYLTESLRRAVTYPAVMVTVLLLILYILFSQVMPVFTSVYESLGTAVPAVTQAAMRIGAVLSTVFLILTAILVVAVAFAVLLSRFGSQPAWIRSVYQWLNAHSQALKAASLRRICSAVSMGLKSSLPTEECVDMAAGLISDAGLKAKLQAVRQDVSDGASFYEAVKTAGIFDGFDLQMLRTGSHAGKLEETLDSLASDYAQKSQDFIEGMLSKIEPAVVAALALAVLLVLLAVMVPLAGILTTIGV